MQHGKNSGEEEEHGVHDAEGEACLEHGARLVDIDGEATEMGVAEYPEGDIVGIAGGDMCAVCASNEAQVVDTSYQSANKAQVD